MTPQPLKRPLRIVLVAGELSGDLLGGAVIRAIKRHSPDAQFFGVGGEKMVESGLDPFASIDLLSVMGLIEVLRHLPRLLRFRRQLIRALLDFKPDLYIGIDAPDFNLPIEKTLRQRGIKTVHLGCPTIWAWRRGRVAALQKAADLTLTLFPFEVALLEKEGLRAEYIGHPLADQLRPHDSSDSSRSQLNLDPTRPVIGLLPGSRMGEVNRLLPRFLDLIERSIEASPSWQFVIPAATQRLKAEISESIADRALTDHVALVEGDSRAVMQASDALLIASGTAALEAMLLGRPMVVCYRLSRVSAFILRRMLYVTHYSLPNILAGREIVPELVQEQVNAPALHAQLSELLEEGSEAASKQLEVFDTLRSQLQKEAGESAARAILDLVEQG